MLTQQINNTRAAALKLEDMACAAPNNHAAGTIADFAMELHAICLSLKAMQKTISEAQKDLHEGKLSPEDATSANEVIAFLTDKATSKVERTAKLQLAAEEALTQAPPTASELFQQFVAGAPESLKAALQAGFESAQAGKTPQEVDAAIEAEMAKLDDPDVSVLVSGPSVETLVTAPAASAALTPAEAAFVAPTL